jgi:hypothetical protein
MQMVAASIDEFGSAVERDASIEASRDRVIVKSEHPRLVSILIHPSEGAVPAQPS